MNERNARLTDHRWLRSAMVCALAICGATAIAQPPPQKLGASRPMPTVPQVSTAAAGTASGAGIKVLLVDDDESDNNSNPASAKLSQSDTFYRQALRSAEINVDVYVVRRYEDGPSSERLKGYDAVVWYTGGSYGGNPSNTAVISLKDEESLRQFVSGGGRAIVVSPGYLNNVLGAGGATLWEKKDSKFLQEVIGIKGGRGLLQRFKGATVTGGGGETLTIAAGTTPVETQFSATNPQSATPLYFANLDPDGKGPRSVCVATRQSVGTGQFVYLGFTLEAADPAAGGAALRAMLADASTPPTRDVAGTSAANPAFRSPLPLGLRTAPLMITGDGTLSSSPVLPLRVGTSPLIVTGAGSMSTIDLPLRVATTALVVSGTGQTSTPPPRRAPPAELPLVVQTGSLRVSGTGLLVDPQSALPLAVTTQPLQVTGTGALQ